MSRAKRIAMGVAVVVGIAAVGVALVTAWHVQTRATQERLLAELERIAREDRAGLVERWGVRVDWTPPTEPQARQHGIAWSRPTPAPIPAQAWALAVVPREPHLHMDSIFICYDGPRVAATLSLSQVGGWLNGRPVDRHRWSAGWMEQPLSPSELDGLEHLTGLLEERVDILDPQSERWGWNCQVLATAQGLLQAQRELAAQEGAKPQASAPGPVQ